MESTFNKNIKMFKMFNNIMFNNIKTFNNALIMCDIIPDKKNTYVIFLLFQYPFFSLP